jgi:hypothetical protein
MCGLLATAWKPVAVVLMGVGSEPGCASAVVAATSPTRTAIWYAVVVAGMAPPTIVIVARGMIVIIIRAHTMAVATVMAAKFTDGTGVSQTSASLYYQSERAILGIPLMNIIEFEQWPTKLKQFKSWEAVLPHRVTGD